MGSDMNGAALAARCHQQWPHVRAQTLAMHGHCFHHVLVFLNVVSFRANPLDALAKKMCWCFGHSTLNKQFDAVTDFIDYIGKAFC